MLRTTLANSYIRRTLRPLYGFEHATPKDSLLDPNWARTVDIYPGMAMMNAATAAGGASNVVSLYDGTGYVSGLAGQYVAPTFGIDELNDAGVNSIAVWVLTPGSEFEVLSPAFDTGVAWTFPTNGTDLLVGAYTSAAGTTLRGKLCPLGTANSSAKPIAIALSRPDTNRLIIAGLNTYSPSVAN